MSANVLAQLGISPVLSGRIAVCDKVKAIYSSSEEAGFLKGMYTGQTQEM
jgi:hypothetical protein